VGRDINGEPIGFIGAYARGKWQQLLCSGFDNIRPEGAALITKACFVQWATFACLVTSLHNVPFCSATGER